MLPLIWNSRGSITEFGCRQRASNVLLTARIELLFSAL